MPFWFDSDEITDPFPLHALQHVLFASWTKKKSLTDFLTSGNFSSMATFGNTPLNFQNNTINTSSFKCFFSLQIVQKLPCLRILSFWGVETRKKSLCKLAIEFCVVKLWVFDISFESLSSPKRNSYLH